MNKPTLGLTVAGSLVLAGIAASTGIAGAANTNFDDFTPLTSSAGPTADEAHPITFGSAAFQQRSIADRNDPARRGRAQQRQLGHDHRQRDRSAQGQLPVHRVRDRPVRRPAARPRHRRDRDDLVQPGAGRPRRLRRLLLDAVGHLHHGRGVVVLGSRRLHDQPLRPAVRAHEPADRRSVTEPLAGEQRRRRLRAPQRDPARLARGHPVRQAPATCTSSTSSTAAASTSTPPPPSWGEIKSGRARLLRRRPDFRAARRRRRHPQRHREPTPGCRSPTPTGSGAARAHSPSPTPTA